MASRLSRRQLWFALTSFFPLVAANELLAGVDVARAGDRLTLAWTERRLVRRPAVGDVVVFHDHRRANKRTVGRLVGAGGDAVAIPRSAESMGSADLFDFLSGVRRVPDGSVAIADGGGQLAFVNSTALKGVVVARV